MGKNPKQQLGIFCIFLPIIFLMYLLFSKQALMPAGYGLALDGYIISRTIVILFTLYVIVKFGFYLLSKKD